MLQMNCVYNKIKRITEKRPKDTLLVCFDFFDTIVSRRFSPEETKKAWAKKCIERYSLPLTYLELYESRIHRERALYDDERNNHEFRYEELIASIYNSYKGVIPVSVSFEDFLSFSACCEKSIEINSQVLNRDAKEALDYCFENGLKTVIVSDFYLGKDYIQEFLINLNAEKYFSEIYVSCDYYKSKRFGDLYKEVKKDNPGCFFIMVGDNYQTDLLRAQEQGFLGVFINRKNQKAAYDRFDQDPFRCIQKRLEALYRNGSALSNYVFALFLLIERLYETTRTMGIHDLYFLARDGEFLKELFDLYLENVPLDYRIHTHYLLVSRNATYLPSCRPLKEETFDGIMSQYNRISISDFLYSLSFSEDQIKKTIRELSCEENSVLSNSPVNPLWRDLMGNDTFAVFYEDNRQRQREAFGAYLQEEINDIRSFVVVDVGWKGSIQNNLYQFLDGNARILGLYYGLTETSALCQDNEKMGLVFSADQPTSEDYRVFSFQSWFMENILTGSNPKVRCYKKTEKGVKIQYEEDSDAILYELIIRKTREEIKRKFQEIGFCLTDTHYSASDFLDTFRFLHAKLTRFYPICHMKQNCIISEMHSEGFGNIRNNSEPPKRSYIKHFYTSFGVKYIVSTFVRYLKLKRRYDVQMRTEQ